MMFVLGAAALVVCGAGLIFASRVLPMPKWRGWIWNGKDADAPRDS